MRIFVHLGLEIVDNIKSQLVDDYNKENTPKAHAPQLQSLLTSYCFATKLGHPVRALPPPVVVPGILRLEKIQVEVYNALTNFQMNGTMRKRAILPRRFGGIVPGSSPVAAAAYVASASQVKAPVYNLNKRMGERKEGAPLGIKWPVMRMGGRNNLTRAAFLTDQLPFCDTRAHRHTN